MEFAPWAKRMGASDETLTSLRAMLLEAPPRVREVLTPRLDGEQLFFTLTEAVIIGRKR